MPMNEFYSIIIRLLLCSILSSYLTGITKAAKDEEELE